MIKYFSQARDMQPLDGNVFSDLWILFYCPFHDNRTRISDSDGKRKRIRTMRRIQDSVHWHGDEVHHVLISLHYSGYRGGYLHKYIDIESIESINIEEVYSPVVKDTTIELE